MSFFSNLFGIGSEPDDSGCDWYCDKCGSYMNDQAGFTTTKGTWKCKECGFRNDVSDNNIISDDY